MNSWVPFSCVPSTKSKLALSIATGSREANIPISFILGAGALAPAQSQDNEIFAMTLIYAIVPFLLK